MTPGLAWGSSGVWSRTSWDICTSSSVRRCPKRCNSWRMAGKRASGLSPRLNNASLHPKPGSSRGHFQHLVRRHRLGTGVAPILREGGSVPAIIPTQVRERQEDLAGIGNHNAMMLRPARHPPPVGAPAAHYWWYAQRRTPPALTDTLPQRRAPVPPLSLCYTPKPPVSYAPPGAGLIQTPVDAVHAV